MSSRYPESHNYWERCALILVQFVITSFIIVWFLVQPVFADEKTADAPAVSAPAIAFAARIVGSDKRFRLIVDFDSNVTHKVYLLDKPKRLIVDLPETLFNLDDAVKRSPSQLVTDFRFGTVAPGVSRIVVSLSDTVKIDRHSFKELETEKRHRLVLDVIESSEEEFASAAKAGAAERAGGKVAWKGDRIQRAAGDDKKFVLILDPGHGGIDGGAVGGGKTIEKDVTLKFALAIQQSMKDEPHIKVLLTRKEDVFVALPERISFARRNKADLLVSIHADSLRQKKIRGATVYTLSEEGSDELSRQLAEKQNRADLIAGLELPKVDTSVTDILIDLTRRETKGFSVRFAKLLLGKMRDGIHLIKNPHRSADFFVLRAADIPSVLLELGYLSNRSDEKLMGSANWRQKAASKLQKATVQFFAPRLQSQ